MTSPALSPALSGPQASMPIPLPGAHAGPPSSAAAGAASRFAQQLQQAQSAPEADATVRNDTPTEARRDAATDAPGADAASTDGPEATDAKDGAAAKARALAARWPALPGAAHAGAAAAGGDARGDTGSDSSVTDRAKAGANLGTEGTTPADPAAAWIASLLPRVAATPTPRGDAAAGSALPADAGDPALATAGLEAGTPATPPGVDDAAQRHGLAIGHDRLAQAQTARLADAGDGPLQALRERLAPADDRAQPLTPVQETGAAGAAGAPAAATASISTTPTLPAFAAELAKVAQAAPASAATASGPAPGPAEVHVAPPVLSPEFVPRLTGELAVLARDGVQEARVQVNPVDLGPIAVKITLDGHAAQVHLAVASDQTRQVLEQAMPSLAAALRESGLTLTGGGVFQQARQNGRDGAADGSGRPDGRDGRGGRGGRGDDGGDGLPAVAGPVRRVRLPGSVDLYA